MPPAPSSSSRFAAALRLASAQGMLGTMGICLVQSHLDPLSLAFYRCLIGVVVMGTVCLSQRLMAGRGQTGTGSRPAAPRRSLALALASGALITANWLLFFIALSRTSIAVSTIAFHVQPFFVVLLGALVLGEALTVDRLGWVVLGFAGLVAAVGITGSTAPLSPAYLIGLGADVAAALCFAGVTLIAKEIKGLRAPELTLIQCCTGTLVLACLGPQSPFSLAAGQWGWLLVLGVVHTGVVYVLIYSALPKLETPVIAALQFVYPASAVLVDALVYRHLISLMQMAGFALIFLAGLGVTLRWQPLRRLALGFR